jgi:acyl-CoA reductase-like NAD-dependent aldehyde dehydrogenase
VPSLLKERQDSIGRIITLEQGKPFADGRSKWTAR